ncbi:MAG: DUF4886 domain-containing protein [Acholeplasmataceae bacterium]|jgi:hypothetical protein|nr:DUF4886 domain-containing protein [Acholeplasmataceae bacterium]
MKRIKKIGFILIFLFVLVSCKENEIIDPIETKPTEAQQTTPTVEEQIKVHFDTDGGTYLSSLRLTDKSLIDAPEIPRKEGHVFLGFYQDKEVENRFSFAEDMIEQTTTLYAKWRDDIDYTKSFKILSIGNSFSQDAHKYLYDIARSYGIDQEAIVIANMYVGGAELSQHVDYLNRDLKLYDYQVYRNGYFEIVPQKKLSEAITLEDWDVITFQQASHYSGMASSFANFLPTLITWARENATNPNLKIGWHMTWAYEQTSTHSGFNNYGNFQVRMVSAIEETLTKKVFPTAGINFVIPSGAAIQNARTSFLGDTLTRDGYHLKDPIGRYIASLTFFKAVTGYKIDEIAFRPILVSELEKSVAIESANNAYESVKVTLSNFKEDTREEEGHIDTELMFVSGYWNVGNYSIVPGDDDFSQQFIASNVLSKNYFKDFKGLTIEAGYKVRVIYLTFDGKDQYYVSLRTEYLTGTSEFEQLKDWSNYDYIAFNIAAISGKTIHKEVNEAASKLSFITKD